MKLRNIIIYKRRRLAAVTHFTEKWATTKPGSSCLNLGTYFNSDPNFALQSELNAGKKLITREMTAQDPVQKSGERRKHGWLNKWPWYDTLTKPLGCFALLWWQGLQKDCCANQDNARTHHDPVCTSTVLPTMGLYSSEVDPPSCTSAHTALWSRGMSCCCQWCSTDEWY